MPHFTYSTVLQVTFWVEWEQTSCHRWWNRQNSKLEKEMTSENPLRLPQTPVTFMKMAHGILDVMVVVSVKAALKIWPFKSWFWEGLTPSGAAVTIPTHNMNSITRDRFIMKSKPLSLLQWRWPTRWWCQRWSSSIRYRFFGRCYHWTVPINQTLGTLQIKSIIISLEPA